MTPPRWFRGDLTAWAIHCAIYRWQLIECGRNCVVKKHKHGDVSAPIPGNENAPLQRGES